MSEHDPQREKLPTRSAEQPQFGSQEEPALFLADAEATTVEKTDTYGAPDVTPEEATEKPRGSWAEAWRELRHSPRFYISAVILLLLIVMACFPGWFTDQDPRFCPIARSDLKPSGAHWFGTNTQGCDIYARTIFGARASIIVGVATTAIIVVLGGVVGAIAGYFGGWVDTILARVTDIFFGIPLLLAALVFMSAFQDRTVWTVVAALGIFGWMQTARIMRGSVITVKSADYVVAARALGAGTGRVLMRHVLPNAVAPVIVVATISLGTFISTEATLSFLGIGLPLTEVSWGADISTATNVIRDSPYQLFFPSLFLSVTVLSFILLGDAVRDALDPKLR
ncbi:ABC transporter permease [Yinghuangia sp. ASG 101]|uniref:ABC transporter permease n=1 Tax=Yinghuangia sp. ASG 101 TaxID=2896848 RepID=UPI001E29E427|nr:ABC transporter permease [Yinghuangia sp. ASG 101]UGQ09456.1 ABC transporter permease [Yinghuangia sp. ASG 101]